MLRCYLMPVCLRLIQWCGLQGFTHFAKYMEASRNPRRPTLQKDKPRFVPVAHFCSRSTTVGFKLPVVYQLIHPIPRNVTRPFHKLTGFSFTTLDAHLKCLKMPN